MKQGIKVRLTKFAAVDKPEFPTSKAKDYVYGDFNVGVSIPIDYWVEGTLLADITNGNVVQIDRINRNGVEIRGLFHSSLVQSFDEKTGTIKTLNSVYKIEEI